MTQSRTRIRLAAPAACIALTSLAACSGPTPEIPKKVCGTLVEPEFTKPLLRSTGKVSEWHTAGWGGKGRDVCTVSVDRTEALDITFTWHADAIDPLKYASPNNSVTGLWEPQRINLADRAALGDDGAIATTRCQGEPKEYFTLTLKLTHDRKIPHLRRNIEQFMRAYMPATMKTVGCTAPRPLTPQS